MALASSLAACSLAHAEVTDIDGVHLERLLESGVPVIDIRTRAEWRDTGVIDGSHLITFFDENGRYDVSSWLARLSEIASPHDQVVLLCRTGRRSTTVSGFLDGQVGYARVLNLQRGIVQWMNEGRPTIAPPAQSE